MAKHGNKLPLRRQREGGEDALLIRSAESLGRMIGSLQRQLDGASRTLSGGRALRMFGIDGRGNGAAPRVAKAADAKPRKKAGAAGVAKSGGKSGATKVRSTADRKSKRASKSAAAKTTAGRARSGASRKASKGTRRG